LIQIDMSENELDKLSQMLIRSLHKKELTIKEMVAVLGYTACCLVCNNGIEGIETMGVDFLESIEEHFFESCSRYEKEQTLKKGL
jgi:hypothetical protein